MAESTQNTKRKESNMETHKQKGNLPAGISSLVRESERVGASRETNRILKLLLDWGLQFTPEQADQLSNTGS